MRQTDPEMGYIRDALQQQTAQHNAETIKLMFDPKKIIEQIIHDLRREERVIEYAEEEYKDENGKVVEVRQIPIERWVRPAGIKPKINEDGLQTLIGILRPRLYYISSLSSFDNDFIVRQILDLKLHLNWIIIAKYEDWEIEKTYRSMLKRDIITPIEHTMYRALDGMSFKGVSESRQEIRETFSDKQKEGRKWP